MKKIAIILLTLVLALSVTACGKDSTDKKELQTQNYGWSEGESTTEELSNGFSIEVFDKNKKETPYSEEKAKYYYEGEPFEFYIKMTNTGSNTIHVAFSTLSNGDLQKFMLDESDEELLDYKVDIVKGGDYVFHVRVNPAEVYTDKWTKINFMANVKYGEELEQDENQYAVQYSLASVYAYAKEEKYEKKGEKHHYAVTDNTYVDVSSQSQQVGLALTDKKEEQEKVQKLIKDKDTLYVYMAGQEGGGEEYTALMYVDGRLVKAFDGQYQVKFKQEKGKVYNFKVDNSVIPEGKHSISVALFDYSYGKDCELTDGDKYTSSILTTESIVEVK